MTREEFMGIVYDELYSDGDNNRANRIIDAADEYAESESEPDTGYWIYDKDTDKAKCSNCGALCFSDNLGRIETQFCHYCGRKMIQK